MNKPVAWIEAYNRGFNDCLAKFVDTHPVKELTDEEIIEIANGCLVGATAWHNPELDPIVFAKAILRKAQEK